MATVNGTINVETVKSGSQPEFTVPGANAMSGGRRLLAAALVAAGNDLVSINNSLITRREALAHAVWNAVLAGEVVFSDGRILQVDDMDQWTSLVKWLHSHIDGPAVTIADSRATNAVVRVVWNDAEVAQVQVPVAGPAIYE